MADPETAKVYGLAQKVASNDASILISGESGCGKEVWLSTCTATRTALISPLWQ